MFNDDDLFGFGGIHRVMHNQFREMDRMMNAMMDPFGMMMGGMGMIEGPYERQPAHRALGRPFDPFRGFGGLFTAMEDLQERAMNDPHSQVYTQSTMVTFGQDGQPRVVENSVRKSGDVKETRRSLRDGTREEMSIGHTIGDRTHIIEKKRDKDGNVRRQQRFVNLDESAAEDFDREFQSRARANMGYSASNGRRALGDSSSGSYRHRSADAAGRSRTGDNAPIITLPDDDEEEDTRSTRARTTAGTSRRTNTGGYSGPVIREISEEEAESSIPKRRRGFGGFFRANDE